MIIKTTLFNWRFTFSAAPITKVIGVNSNLPDGTHIIMWDFDDTTFWTVHDALLETQKVYKLPNIYILETKENTNFIAYCFKRVQWRKLVEILAFTKGLDWNYYKYGIYRGCFTLRVSPKGDRRPQLKHVLKSQEREDAYITDLKSWVQYETLADGFESKKVEVNV